MPGLAYTFSPTKPFSKFSFHMVFTLYKEMYAYLLNLFILFYPFLTVLVNIKILALGNLPVILFAFQQMRMHSAK